MMRTPQIVLALAIGIAAGAVIAAQEPPPENKGMEAKQLAGFDIGKQGCTTSTSGRCAPARSTSRRAAPPPSTATDSGRR
jgi:hypothetical protein